MLINWQGVALHIVRLNQFIISIQIQQIVVKNNVYIHTLDKLRRNFVLPNVRMDFMAT